jgi:phosphate acetyltransferase
MSEFLEQLPVRAAALKRRIVFAEGHDDRTIHAVARLQRAGVMDIILLGSPADDLRRAVDAAEGDGDGVVVLDPTRDERRERFAEELAARRKHRGMTRSEALEHIGNPLYFAAMLVCTGEADGAVAGAAHTTAEVLRAALWCIGPAPGIETISSSFYMVVPPFRGTDGPEVLTFTDAGVVPDPGVEQLADIAQAAVEARRKIVGDEPRVAFLSYSTHGSAPGSSVDRMRAALALFRERMPDVPADGELQADAALIPDVAVRKAPRSTVAGQANVLVFPNLDAGNIAYKLVQRLARAEAIGPIVQGLARPYNDLSRGASIEDIVHVACVTALLA